MALDYAKTAVDIVEKVGGPENVDSVSHCMTRLRFILKDEQKADMDAIKNIKGVLGCVNAGGQMQVIMGQNLIDTYNQVISQFNFKEGAAIDENLDDAEPLTWKERLHPAHIGKVFIDYVSASVTPMIPGLIAGGMVKVILLLITKVMPDFADSSTYTMLSLLGDAPFYFMPIMVAYGASKKLNANPIYAMLVAAAMIAPGFIERVNEGTATDIFGLPVHLQAYTSQMFPSLMIAWVAAKLEVFFNKIVPGVLRAVLVGCLTMILTYTATMVVMAPIGAFVGEAFIGAITQLYNIGGPIVIGLLTGVLPFLVMTGMHTPFGAFMTQMLATNGYDPLLRPAMFLHNMAEGGAVLGVFLRAKDPEVKSEALTAAVGCIVAGVTEPAIYGFNLRLKKPLIATCVGGFIGGATAGFLGMRSFEFGYSNIWALPIFGETIVAAVIATIVAIAAPCIITMVLGFDEKLITGEE